MLSLLLQDLFLSLHHTILRIIKWQYCMYKKQLPILNSKLIYKIGNYFYLEIYYYLQTLAAAFKLFLQRKIRSANVNQTELLLFVRDISSFNFVILLSKAFNRSNYLVITKEANIYQACHEDVTDETCIRKCKCKNFVSGLISNTMVKSKMLSEVSKVQYFRFLEL